MKLATLFFGLPEAQFRLSRQMGVTHAIAKLAPEITGELPPWDLDTLARQQARFAGAGLTLHGLEGDQFDVQRIKLGLPGRDEDIERYQAMLRNMGRLGIRLLCYNFMAGIGWYRTSTDERERGGALTSGFDAAVAARQPATEFGEVSEERLWDNYRYFVGAVLPVAEEAGVRMGLHPDDPPVSPLRGIGRILTSADAVRRALALSPSSSHGVTFCQGTFGAMGEDVGALAREFGARGRIVFVHFRDVRGTRERFVETFQDNGPRDMAALLRAYHEAGFDGAIRPDHVPTMDGEPYDVPGYGVLGRLFAVGYMKGLLEGLGIPSA